MDTNKNETGAINWAYEAGLARGILGTIKWIADDIDAGRLTAEKASEKIRDRLASYQDETKLGDI